MNQEEKTPTVYDEIEALQTMEGFVPAKGLPIPFRDMVIILPIMQGDKKTASGIILPGNSDAANDRKRGVVARFGPDVTIPIKIGMEVFFESKGNYYLINGIDGNVYLFMHQHLIYGACTPDTYFIPSWKSREEKRNDSRREGLANVSKAETEALNDENTQVKIG